MPKSRTARNLALALLASLILPGAWAAGEPADALTDKASAAFEAKHYAEAAGLFEAAAGAGKAKVTPLYNAACAWARAGKADAAFRDLQASIDAGLGGQSPADDPDLASLHADPRWAPMLARYEAAHPELAATKMLQDEKLTPAHRYFAGRRAIAAGAHVDDRYSLFNQYYANAAEFVGEYDEASRVYFMGKGEDVVAAGFTHAVPAVPAVLAQARGRQAVFLNESHAQVQTRASSFAMLAGLRAEGFDVLAMETLAYDGPVPRDATHCASTSIKDTGLQARGYALTESGYYSKEPVYAEMVREALRLGFRLVAYDINADVAEREQNEAENLACIFKQNPKARLVAIAGFDHIGESPNKSVPGGWMAARFRVLTGIDPLTVDSTTQLALDPAKLQFAPHQGAAEPASWLLTDAEGKPFRDKDYDLVLYVPAPAHRSDGQPSWLTLGGTRKPTAVAAAECHGHDPCLVEARHPGELANAVASDRCIIAGAASGCSLYLRPGEYEITAFDDAEQPLGHRVLTVQ